MPAGQHDRRTAFFYEHATVVFVGKSLTAIGGQNPIEPAALGKAMVFGPNMQNFAEITRKFVAEAGALQVRDKASLETAIAGLLADENRRRNWAATRSGSSRKPRRH